MVVLFEQRDFFNPAGPAFRLWVALQGLGRARPCPRSLDFDSTAALAGAAAAAAAGSAGKAPGSGIPFAFFQ